MQQVSRRRLSPMPWEADLGVVWPRPGGYATVMQVRRQYQWNCPTSATSRFWDVRSRLKAR